MAQRGKRDEREQPAKGEGERQEQAYEPPQAEEAAADEGLAVTAAGTSPPTYGAITLVEDDEEDE